MNQSTPSSNPLDTALKIWISGIALGPVFYLSLESFLGQSDVDYEHYGIVNLLRVWLLYLAGGIIVSLPLLLLMWLGLRRRAKEEPKKALSLTFTLAFGTIVTLLPFGFTPWGIMSYPAAGYLAAVWLGVFWAFRSIARQQKPAEPLDGGL